MTALAPLPLVEQFQYGLDAPICLTWELTYAGNHSCVHCLSTSGQSSPRELSTDECKAVIDERERMQVFYVNIGGGEPTVRPDFWELVDYATEHHVEADPARLQQVYWNLIKNAVKFPPRGGLLSIRTHPDDEGRLVVEVIDTGRGIALDVLPKIFNAFEQGESSITRRFGGLGLGLAISQRIAAAMGTLLSLVT